MSRADNWEYFEKIEEIEMPEEMMEVAASPAEEKLVILLQPAEGEILSEGEFADFTDVISDSQKRKNR